MNRLTTRARHSAKSRRLLAFGVLALFAFDGASAATKTWDAGGGDLLWSTGNNWNTNGTPADDDTIVFASSFASGTAINLNGNRTIEDLSITSTTDFSLNNNTLTISSGDITRSAASGTTTINSGIALGGSAAWNIAGNLIANGIVSGPQSLTKSGAGTLTLANANTFTGDTTVSAGILNIRNSASLGAVSGNTIVNTNGELQLQGGITVAAGETLSLTGTGAGGTGSAALRNISGNNAWTDAITLQDVTGVVRINSDADTLTLGAISETGNRNKILTIGGAGNVTVTGVISGGGSDTSVVKDGTGTLTLANSNTYSGTTTVSAGTLSAGKIVVSGGNSSLGNATSTVTLGSASTQGTLAYTGSTATYTRGFTLGGAGGGRLDVTTSGQTLTVGTGNVTGSGLFTVGGAGNTTISSSLTHSGGLTKTDAGTLTLSSTGNTYTGLTDVQAGTLALGASNVLANASTLRVSGGILDTTASSYTDTVSVFNMSSGSLNGTGTITATTYGLSGGTVTGNLGAGTMNVTGAVALNGTAAATAVNINSGTLTLGSSNRLADTAAVTVNGGTFAIGASSDTVGSVTLVSGGITGGSGVLTSTTAYDLRSGSISANLGGAVDVNKTTAGTVFLSGNNSYTGVTTFGGGIVNVANLTNYGVAGSLGQRAVDTNPPVSNVGLRFMGGTLQYTGSTAQSTDRDIRVGNAGATLDASGSNPAATMSFTKSGPNVDIWDTDGARTLTLTGSNTGDNIFAINWQERAAGRSNIVKSGSGTWVLTNPNNSAAQTNDYNTFGGYGGGTTISDGTLGFVENAIGGGVVDFTGNATLRWESGNTQDITTGSGAGAARSVRIGDGVTATFNTNGNDVSLSNAFGVGPLKTGAIAKTGAGTLTLSAAHTYTGTTTVSAGTLVINGAQVDATGNVLVSGSTSRLEGTGTVGAKTTTITDGGTLAAGLTFNGTGVSSDLVFASNSIFEWDISATGNYSLTNVEGNLSGTGAIFRILLNDFEDAFWDSDHSWTLTDIFAPASITPGSTFATIFTGLETNQTSMGGGRGFAISGTTLTWAAVPEPTSALVSLLLAGGLLRRRRR
jgi:autotransporter-associated beta strand protein